MTLAVNELLITRHARERFVERSQAKYKHLEEHNKPVSCPSCKRIWAEIVAESSNVRDVNDRILKALEDAKESNRFLNNSNFMDYLYKKYGYDRLEIRATDDLIFIIKFDGGPVLVTVLKKNQWF